MSYTKLFGSILLSTVWELDSEARIVWITMLALCDRDGIVAASVPGLARQAAVSRQATERALAAFLAPDPDSRTPDHGGRRIEPVDGGWRLLNHAKYRDMDTAERRREADARRQAEKRERDRKRHAVTERDTSVTGCDMSLGIHKVTPSDTDQMQSKSDTDPEGRERASAPPPSSGVSVGSQPNPPASPEQVAAASKLPRFRGTRLPEGWTPSAELLAELAAEGHRDTAATLVVFRDYWAGVPGQRGVKLDWPATFRNWVRKDAERSRAGPSRPIQRDANGPSYQREDF